MGLVGLVEFQMIITNESMDFNDPKELDDHQLFDDPSYLMIVTNESMDFNDPKKFNDPQLFGDPSYQMVPAIQ